MLTFPSVTVAPGDNSTPAAVMAAEAGVCIIRGAIGVGMLFAPVVITGVVGVVTNDVTNDVTNVITNNVARHIATG